MEWRRKGGIFAELWPNPTSRKPNRVVAKSHEPKANPRFIPAGMILRETPCSEHKPRNKKKNTTQISETDEEIWEVHESATAEKISPPEAICRNKGLVLDEFQFQYNQNCVFNTDMSIIRQSLLGQTSENATITSNSSGVQSPRAKSEPEKSEDVETEASSFKKNTHKIDQFCKRSNNKNNAGEGSSKHIVASDCEEDWDRPLMPASKLQRPSEPRAKQDVKESEISAPVAELPAKNQKCDSEDCESPINHAPKVKKGPPFLKPITSTKPVAIKEIYNTEIIVHGIIVPKPVKSVNETYFNEDVKRALALKCPSPTPVQAYMWPAIQKGLDAFIVAPPRSGKTFSYIPAICTFALIKRDLGGSEGPLVLVLCSSYNKCKELKRFINSVNNENWDPVIVDILEENPKKINCDIAIATPGVLENCLPKLQGVRHVVLEEADVLLKNSGEFMSRFFKFLNEAQIESHSNLQLILCSEKWSKDIDVLMGNMHVTPVICFQDFFEAAIYANVRIEKKVIGASHKNFFLEDSLKQHYSTHRTVIFCKNNEILSVGQHLQTNGVECIFITNDLIEDEIFENEDMWSSLKTGRFKVLLCTDDLLEKTLEFLNAEWIVHYSLPATWETFQKRFRCLTKNLHSPLDTENFDSKKDLRSYLIPESEELCNEIFGDYYSVLIRRQVGRFSL